MGSVGPERDVTGLYFRMLILLKLSVYGAIDLRTGLGTLEWAYLTITNALSMNSHILSANMQMFLPLWHAAHSSNPNISRS